MAEFKSPLQYLGFEPGADRKLADWPAMLGYFQQLADASPRVLLREVGKSTEDRPFIYLVISSEANLAKLEHYRAIQAKLADPRGLSEEEAQKLIAEGKTIAMISCGIHATEIGGPQCSLTLAYELAAGIAPNAEQILDNVIFILVPSLNPDGHQMVCDWYFKNLNTPWEGGPMPWLYQKYVGHDNNRDWYMFTQQEVRLTIEHIHNQWHPQVIYDMHQMGATAARFYIPPFVDPIEPNVDPILQQNIIWTGTNMAQELTAQGKKGVLIHAIYDAWTPARAYQHSHGGIRILSEAASVKIATPVTIKFEEQGTGIGYDAKKRAWNYPEPWPGGEWHLSDIVDYERIASYAMLTHAARNRDIWLRNFYLIGKKAVERSAAPLGFIFPTEQRAPLALKALLEVMQFAMVELAQLEEPVTINGKTYAAGSFVIPANQPYFAFAKALLEKQAYPDMRAYPGGPPQRPYDVTAHTLNILMGVDVDALDCIQELKLKPIKELPTFAQAAPQKKTEFYLLSPYENLAFTCVAALLAAGFKVRRFTADTPDCVAGTWQIQAQEGLEAELAKWSEKGLRFSPCNCTCQPQTVEQKPVRLGLYKSWTGSMDEGWTRFTLEQFGIPYISLHNEDITGGKLAEKVDVLLLPSMPSRAIKNGHDEKTMPPEYQGGLGEKGAEAIKEFVAAGGRLIVSDNSTAYAIDIMNLPLDNTLVDKNAPQPDPRQMMMDMPQNSGGRKIDFFIPGSLLKVKVDSHHPLTWGARDEEVIWFQRSPAFVVDEGARLMHYPSENPLVSGWIYDPQNLLNGRCALAHIPYGKGKVACFGFNPVYRAQAHNSHKFLFNAIFEAGLGGQ